MAQLITYDVGGHCDCDLDSDGCDVNSEPHKAHNIFEITEIPDEEG